MMYKLKIKCRIEVEKLVSDRVVGVMARVESLRGRYSAFELRKAERQVDGLFESVLSETFHG